MNNIEFEARLFEMRMAAYRHPKLDIISDGFRPVSGKVADFGTIEHQGRHHFYYIERRLQEGTPFYPGNEIYFGHASSPDFFQWEVHDPVMLIRPGADGDIGAPTWEEAHVWAPFVFRFGGRFVMAYTGVNRFISQDIGLAFSDDLFEWERWEGNPISPCKGREWAFWREECISSCRDPHVLEHEGRIWMCFTANTRDGESCIALTSTNDLVHWEDHGPILVGPAEGYEPRLEGGHPQGSLESSNLLMRNGKWMLLVNAAVRDTPIRCWAFEGDRMDSFDFTTGREFWRGGGGGVEIVKEKGSRALLASFAAGTIRFGDVDWSEDHPTAEFVTAGQLKAWRY